MALTMILELEGVPPDWAAVEAALKAVGVAGLEHLNKSPAEPTGSVAYFEHSITQIAKIAFDGWEGEDGNWHKGPRPFVSAEGRHNCRFTVSEGLSFRIDNSRYDESVEDIRAFLTQLAELSSMQFVLSFQQEGVYAINCRNQGFQFFWHQPRDANWEPPAQPPF